MACNIAVTNFNHHAGIVPLPPRKGGSIVQQAHTAKQEALDAIERMPDNADTEEIMYRLYVLENIRRGQQDAAEGKTQPAEEVLKEIQTW